MIKTIKLFDASAKTNSFTDADVDIANKTNPPSNIVALNYSTEYTFKRQLIRTKDLVDPNDTSFQSQTARQGRHPFRTRIANSMRESGINLVDVTIVVNPVSDNKWEVVDGYGRSESLQSFGFENLMAFVPTRPMHPHHRHLFGSGLNDHLPRSPITAADIVMGFLKVVQMGGIIGITKTMAKRYYESDPTLTEQEITQYISAVTAHVRSVGRNNHGDKAITSMVSKITLDAKLVSKSDVFLMDNDGSFAEHLVKLNFDPTNNINIVLPILSDMTRKPENVFGTIVNAYSNAVAEGDRRCLEENSEVFLVTPNTVNAVIGLSKWLPTTNYSKMRSIQKIYLMRKAFKGFLTNIAKMAALEDLFTDKNKIPRIGIMGFVCPWLPLQNYGWPYKGVITYDENVHPSFNTVVNDMCADGLLTSADAKKLLIS